MAEYIDREAAIRVLSNPITMSMCVQIDECKLKRQQRETDLELIKSLPAEDVQPVKHGRWIDGDCRCVTAVCSNCNRLRLGNGAKSAMRLALYCEKCGARMDGET